MEDGISLSAQTRSRVSAYHFTNISRCPGNRWTVPHLKDDELSWDSKGVRVKCWSDLIIYVPYGPTCLENQLNHVETC